jgi:hydroxyacylglutathione hydrolase
MQDAIHPPGQNLIMRHHHQAGTEFAIKLQHQLEHPLTVMAKHPDRVQRASRMTATEFEARRDDINGLQLVDIRNPGEFVLGTIGGAAPIPVGQLPGRLEELDPTAPTVVFCAGGYRSSVGASVLRQAGFDDVSDILGGYGAWVELIPASA